MDDTAIRKAVPTATAGAHLLCRTHRARLACGLLVPVRGSSMCAQVEISVRNLPDSSANLLQHKQDLRCSRTSRALRPVAEPFRTVRMRLGDGCRRDGVEAVFVTICRHFYSNPAETPADDGHCCAIGNSLFFGDLLITR